MGDFKFCINWDSYHNYVSKGFSSLQQHGEFVDMTLAADGHFVKVHQNIVALASPYLKAMLQSVTCQHPVIFLYSINSEILGYILEYIYTGEVKVPTNNMETFVKACKSLCINGLDTLITSESIPSEEFEVPSENKRIDKPATHITINTQDSNNYNLEVIPSHNSIDTNHSKEIILSDHSLAISNDNDKMNNDNRSNEIVDINSINNHIVLEPNDNMYNNIEFNRIDSDCNVGIINDIYLNGPSQSNDIEMAADMQTSTDNYQNGIEQCISNIQLQQNPINITMSFSNITEKGVIINEESILPNIAINSAESQIQQHVSDLDANLAKVSLRDVRKPKPGNLNTELDIQKTQDTYDDYMDIKEEELPPTLLKIKTQKMLKSLKKIGLHMKLKNESEKLPAISLNRIDRIKMDKLPHFTISNRGALQLILSRFLYHSHHHSHGGIRRRWRCVDYRKLHCPAFIDTHNEEITAMSTDHTHPNHELIIKKKIKTNIVFTSLTNAVNTINTFITNLQDETKTSVKERKNKRIEKYFLNLFTTITQGVQEKRAPGD